MDKIKDIIIYDNKSCSCYERSLATICCKEDKHFEMMFLDAWDFNLEKKEPINKMGDVLYIEGWNLETSIEKYHGIKLNKFTVICFDKSFEELLKQEISENRFIIIDEEYLLYDIDFSNDYKLYSMRNSKFVSYSPEEFSKICHEIICYSYEQNHVILSYDQIAEHTKQRLLSTNEKIDVFKKMDSFAEIFYYIFDPLKEFEMVEEYDKCRLIEFLIETSRGRKLFSLNIDSELSNQKQLNELLIMAEAKWSSIMALFVKIFYSKEMTNVVKNKIYKSIKEAIAIEKEAFLTLCNSINQ